MAATGDTIVALSSGRPPSAIAVVRMSGPQAAAAASAIAGPMPPARKASLRTFNDPSGEGHIDQGLLLFFPAPHSVSGEDVVEFQCHGGRAVIDALLGALLAQDGVRLAEPGEFTRRALASGRIDLTEAEGLADLLAAETEAQRRAALISAEGGLRRQLEQWRERLLGLSARVEVAIDYSDEEDGSNADQRLALDIGALAEAVGTFLARPTVEPLRDGIRVVFAGPPNAGKSSLVNVLANSDRAIVTPIAGTTRDSIEVPLAIGGLPFVLVDTAGLRDSDDPVETLGVQRAAREIDRADIVVWLGEPRSNGGAIAIPIQAKSDLGVAAGGALPVSAATGEGVEQLLHLIVSEANSIIPSGDEIALNRRQSDNLLETLESLRRAFSQPDIILMGEDLRAARESLDRITGRIGVEELLDALFGRFCLGK